MRADDVLAKVADSVAAGMVYAEPVTRDGVTVVAAARVVTGGGGGGGADTRGRQGEGSGMGLVARPVGAFEITDRAVRWVPAVDVNRVVTTVGAVAVTALLLAARVVRPRRR